MSETGCPLERRFAALAGRRPDTAAVLRPDGSVEATRAQLAESARRLAGSLRRQIAPGSTALLSLPNGTALITAFLALRRIGVRTALVDATFTGPELERAAATVGAAAVLAHPSRMLGTGQELEGRLEVARTSAPTLQLPPKTAVLKLTSGSTGAPAAIAVTAAQLVADAVQIMRTMGIGGTDVTLAAVPLTHSYGIGSCLLPLLVAGSPLVFPTSALPGALHAAVAGAGVTHFPAVPAMIRALATVGDDRPFSTLRVCLAAGAALAPDDAAAFFDRYGTKVHVFYGSSECGGITYDRTHEPVHVRGAVGTAMHRVTVEIVDDDETCLPRGAEGRVRVRSRAVAAVAIPANGDLRAGEFLTGDLGILDATGRLRLTGRAHDILNVAGRKLHPEEVRLHIESIAGVRGAVVVGLPDRHRGDLIATVVAVEPGLGITVRSILAACRAGLAPHKVPRKVVIVDELPVSDRGKVKREAVLRLLADDSR